MRCGDRDSEVVSNVFPMHQSKSVLHELMPPIQQVILILLCLLQSSQLWATEINSEHRVHHQGNIDEVAALAPSHRALLDKYNVLKPQLASNTFGKPIVIASDLSNGYAKGELFSVLAYPYKTVAPLFTTASQWCEAMALNIKIKSCTYSINAKERTQVDLYVGNEGYQAPEDTHHFSYEFIVNENGENYAHTHLGAESGPLDTSGYIIDIEVAPINSRYSFLHLSYSAKYGFFARTLLRVYLATIGRNKVGFTQTGVSNDGSPVYVKGIQGVVERNTMRYLLAFKAYLYSHQLPQTQQFETRIERWYDLTMQYQQQLYELDKQSYLQNKRKEHANQLTLQLTENEDI